MPIFRAPTEPKHGPTYLGARQAHLRRSWSFHGGELLRLVGMLVDWKASGAVGGDPREVRVEPLPIAAFF